MAAAKFRVGDRVRLVKNPVGGQKIGDLGTVSEAGFGKQLLVRYDRGEGLYEFPGNIELLPVAPQPTGPVRTVTRREIVPGVYGRVCVEKGRLPFMASACLVDRSNKKHSEVNYLDASELREAARIFNEIADVLEEGE